MSAPAARPVRLGVVGLGRGFMLMLPTLVRDARIRLVACADPRAEARAQFEADFPGARAYPDAASLVADDRVEAVYVASPHQFHLEHVRLAAGAGRHVLVEKPIALALEDARAMTAAAAAAGVMLLVGPSHSYDAPVLRAREIIAGGAHGRLRMVTSLAFTDWLYRPRRPEELDTARGGGVVFSQAPHQVEVARLLAGRPVRAVRAAASAWDPARRTEGAYQAFLDFGPGLSASLTYSGHAHFDTDAWMDWHGELGQRRDPARHGEARALLAGARTPEEEAALKERRTYGRGVAAADLRDAPAPPAHEHLGVVIASCERADLRLTPFGVEIHAAAERRVETVPTRAAPRAAVVDALHAAVVHGTPPLQDGAFGTATLEVCLAILDSARTGREVVLRREEDAPCP